MAISKTLKQQSTNTRQIIEMQDPVFDNTGVTLEVQIRQIKFTIVFP